MSSGASTVHRVRSDADLERCVDIAGAIEEVSPTVEQLREVQDRLLLHDGGGYAYVNTSSVAGSAYAMVRVLPGRRRRGIGSVLLERAVAAARELGMASAWGYVLPGDEGSLRFATTRGFCEVGRDVELRRRLVPGEGTMPPDVVELGPELFGDAYRVAVAATPDMVTAGAAQARGFDEWAEDIRSARIAFVALHAGAVVGYATLHPFGDPARLEHGFTGVLPEHRRRGFATALGSAQIAWAAAHGYEQLVTTTGVTNTGLRRQKATLGYAELEGPVLVRGPV